MIVPPTSPSEVRLSDLVEWNVPIAWHEAVAVVRDVARQVSSGGPSAGVPGTGQIQLSREGRLLVPAAFGGPGDLAPSLSALLLDLLPTSAPADLQVLADDQNPTIRQASGQEFIDALSFFARPDDAAEIDALAQKAYAALEARDRQAALQALTDRARHAAPAVADAPPTTRKPLGTRRLAMVVGAAIVLLGGAGLAWTLTRTPPANGQPAAAVSPLERVASRVQQSMTTAAAFVQETLETPPAPVAGRGKDLTLPARRGRKRGPALEPAQPPAANTSVSAAPVGAVDAPASESRPGASEAVAEPVVDTVFSASNADVAPPMLARPQMPGEQIAGLPTGRPGVLELLVGRDGQVTSARLVPASNRHQDRMMVSAAKTWRFSPAMRDGKAVSYRLQMPITW